MQRVHRTIVSVVNRQPRLAIFAFTAHTPICTPMPAGGVHNEIGGCSSSGVLPTSGSPVRGRAGFKCCRWCTKSTLRRADKTTMFREIPSDSRFYGAGAYLPGSDINGVVCGSSHANSRFLCTEHHLLRVKHEASAGTLLLLHTTPLLLPPDTPHRCSCPRNL